MAKYEKSIDGDFELVICQLHADIMSGGLSMNLVDGSDWSVGGAKVAVRVYDKYFMRNGSRASLSLTVASEDGRIFISAIGAGGGDGMLFNFSLGAESDMVCLVENSVNRMASSWKK